MNDLTESPSQPSNSTQPELPVFLVASRVRNFISDQGFKLSEDTVDALNTKLLQILNQAIERTKANKRLTVRPHDL